MNTAQTETCEKIAEARFLDTADTSWSAVARHKLADLADEAQRSAEHFRDTTAQAIRRDPTRALIIAAALGGVLGLVAKRRLN